MSNIHYTELFYSIQGEGRFMGVPSIFLRTFGCNFRCMNFGRDPSNFTTSTETHNPEVVEIIKNIDKYKSFSDLPIIKTGCDSYSSVYPEFKKFVLKEDTTTIVNRIIEMLPHKHWQDEHLVITGGEPLLGWQRSYPALLDHFEMHTLSDITFETNGTQELSSDLESYLIRWQMHPTKEVTFSVSAKLSCSGEERSEAIRPDVVCQYEDVGYTYLKFVVATDDDVEEALDTISLYRNEGFLGPVYLMPVGGVETVYSLNNRKVAELALKHGLRYSDRLQVPLFKNAWST